MKHATPFTSKDIISTLRKHREVLQRYQVRRIGLFGSYVSGTPHKRSDIDLLVEFEEPTFDRFMDLTADLEKLFGKEIEILTPEGIRGIRIKRVAQHITKHVRYVSAI